MHFRYKPCLTSDDKRCSELLTFTADNMILLAG